VGGTAHVYIFSYPHWVDTRNVAFNMGEPDWNSVLFEMSEVTNKRPEPRAVIFNPRDTSNRQALLDLWPGACTWSVRWLAQHDPAKRLTFVPCQAANLEARAPGVTRAACQRAVVFVAPGEQPRSGARAVFAALALLPGLWGRIGRFLLPAAWLFEPGYRLVARFRHRLSGWLGLDACRLDNVGEP